MSHYLDVTTGRAAMAYVGETPWHGLGERLQENKPIEDWIRAARLDWQIQMLPVHYQFEGHTRLMSERFVLARSDNGSALSIVSGDYQVVQPKEILEFYRDLVEERGYALETAGALDNGRKVWALAKTGLVANVAGNVADQLGAYVLLATSCDKSLATTATFTSIRVVCQNTLAFAFDDVSKQNRRSIKVDHSRKFDPRPIKESLGLIDEAWANFLFLIDPMAKIKLNDADAQRFLSNLFLTDKEIGEEKTPPNTKAKEINQLFSLYKSASGQSLDTAKGTLWGALNAVTYYADHVRGRISTDRLDSAWFGAGASLKEKAWQRAVQFLKPSV